jgi:hypothetical protein
MRVDACTPEAEGVEAVLLNGERIKLAIAADDEAGWVTFYATPGQRYEDTRGTQTVYGDNPTVTLHGDVKIVQPPIKHG